MRFQTVCVALLLAGPAFGASFDCGKALTPREKLICADKDLSEEDSKLADLYGAAQKNLSDAGRRQLVTEQRAWLRFLAQACPVSEAMDEQDQRTTMHCLSRRYSERIEDLGQTGVRIGPYVFTRSVEYRAVVSPEPDEQDETGILRRGIGTHETANPKIDSPRTPITDRWNIMNDRRDSGDFCESAGDQLLTGSVAFANGRLISVEWDNSFYCHGTAHGNGVLSAQTLILSPWPHALRASDLFQPDGGWLQQLTTLVTAAVRKSYFDDYKKEPKHLDEKAIADAAGDPQHWLITADGLQILFSPYELGGYSFVPTVVIPWSELKDQMVRNPPVL